MSWIFVREEKIKNKTLKQEKRERSIVCEKTKEMKKCMKKVKTSNTIFLISRLCKKSKRNKCFGIFL